MGRFLSINFWVSTLLSTFFVMLMIYLIKKFAAKYNIPVVSAVAAEV